MKLGITASVPTFCSVLLNKTRSCSVFCFDVHVFLYSFVHVFFSKAALWKNSCVFGGGAGERSDCLVIAAGNFSSFPSKFHLLEKSKTTDVLANFSM